MPTAWQLVTLAAGGGRGGLAGVVATLFVSQNTSMLPAVLRHNRAFARLWGASAISNAGSMLTYLALPLVTYAVTKSGATYAAVSAAEVVGTLVSMLVGGALADRLNRRRLMLIGDALLFLAAIGVGFAVHGKLWTVVVALAFAQGAVGGLFAAHAALLRDIVEEGDRTQANALGQVSINIVSLVSPLVGVGLFASFGFTPIVIIDALSFAASFALVWGVRDPVDRSSEAVSLGSSVRSVATDIRAGLTLARSDRYLSWIVAASGINGMSNGIFAVAIVPWLAEVRHLPSSAYGLVITGIGASGLLTAFVAARMASRITPQSMILIGGSFASVGAIGFIGVEPLLVLALGVLCFGVGNVFVGIGSTTLTQTRFPSHYQGRIGAMNRLFFVGPNLVGVAVTGMLIGVMSPTWLVTGFAISMVIGMSIFAYALRFTRDPVALPDALPVHDLELATSG